MFEPFASLGLTKPNDFLFFTLFGTMFFFAAIYGGLWFHLISRISKEGSHLLSGQPALVFRRGQIPASTAEANKLLFSKRLNQELPSLVFKRNLSRVVGVLFLVLFLAVIILGIIWGNEGTITG